MGGTGPDGKPGWRRVAVALPGSPIPRRGISFASRQMADGSKPAICPSRITGLFLHLPSAATAVQAPRYGNCAQFVTFVICFDEALAGVGAARDYV